VSYPKAGHFPELEDPEISKRLLLDGELWNDLRMSERDRRLQNVLGETKGSEDGKDSPMSISDHSMSIAVLSGHESL